MKKTTTIMIMMILLTATFGYSAVFEIINETEKILVTMINQEPDPVSPGNVVTVKFRIENYKTEPAKNMEVKIVPKFPFSLYGDEESVKSIGTLSAGQSGSIGVRVEYKLLVDSDAVEGDNELEFLYRIDGGAWVKAQEFTVDIRPRDAILAINEIKTDPIALVPGKMTNVRFRLDNLETSAFEDVKLKLNLLTTITTATSFISSELPFTPIGSGDEKTLARIDAGKSRIISFDLFTDAGAESKVYKVPYTLTYSDDAGTNYTRTGIVGLLVDAEPELSINIDSTEIYSAGAKGIITIKFVNKGFSDVKFLDVILSDSDEFDLLSNPEVYIGNLDSDDYETADYTLIVNSRIKDKIILPLSVEYRDSNGKLYSQKMEMELPLYSGMELKKREDKKSSSPVGFIILIVIIGAGYYFYRKRKNKKKKL